MKFHRKSRLRLKSPQGFKPKTLSAVIMAEKPKLFNYIDIIKENLAKLLNIGVDKIGLSATTLEGLGFIGREEAFALKPTF